MDESSSEIVALPRGPTRVQWRRHQRARRVSLRIDPRGDGVVITLPMRAARSAGVALLMHHAGWVAERLAALPAACVIADGAHVPFRGTAHRVSHCPGTRGGAWLADGEIRVSGEPSFIGRRVSDLLRAEAKRRLTALVIDKAALANLRVRRVTVKDTRSRWGSCSAEGTLMFSWRLIMAPDFVQDYVVAHEVAHLRHMNHGQSFWALVAELSQNVRPAVLWLKRNGPDLLRIA